MKDGRSKPLQRRRNRFLMGKKAKPSRASTIDWSWARWPSEVLSSLNDSVKHRLQVIGPQEQRTGHREGRFWEKTTEQRPWVDLTDTCAVRTKEGRDIVCCSEVVAVSTPSTILIQRCPGGCWSTVCHHMAQFTAGIRYIWEAWIGCVVSLGGG